MSNTECGGCAKCCEDWCTGCAKRRDDVVDNLCPSCRVFFGVEARDTLAPMIKPYRQAVTLAKQADEFADIVPPEDAEVAEKSREFAKFLRNYAGPDIGPPIPPAG